MNRLKFTLITSGIIILTSCKQNENQKISDVEIWLLGWRMMASSMDENYELASLQFDSLIESKKIIDKKHLVKGLEAKKKIGMTEEVNQILKLQDNEVLQEICINQFLADFEPCKEYTTEKIENRELQTELIKMFVDDQAVRGNVMEDIILKYNIDMTEITQDNGVMADEKIRNRLKEIFSEYGFPTKKMVGKDAMQGVFLMIQHSDGDIEWQKAQLSNIEKAVKKGDMDGQSYAYLYDRIKINNGEKQLYGTQFANIDPIKKVVELAETEDIDNLDKRRMQVGMMPIKMYKEIILKNF